MSQAPQKEETKTLVYDSLYCTVAISTGRFRVNARDIARKGRPETTASTISFQIQRLCLELPSMGLIEFNTAAKRKREGLIVLTQIVVYVSSEMQCTTLFRTSYQTRFFGRRNLTNQFRRSN